MDKQHQRTLSVVVGLGVTGLACVRYLMAQGVAVAVTDSRVAPPGLDVLQQTFPQVPCEVGGFSEALLNQATEIILSPGVSLQDPHIAAQSALGVPVIGDIELFARVAKAPIIAITGSNGKTTVTTLVGEMIKQAGFNVAVGGNIGEPVLDLLDDDIDYYVLELSSFQLETTVSLNAAVSVLLNLSPDHMDRYASIVEYCQAKQRIYQGCQQAIVNLQQPAIWQSLTFDHAPIRFGLDVEADFTVAVYQGEDYVMAQGEPWLAVSKLPLHASHHLQNALAALALAHAIKLPKEAVLSVLQRFKGLPHRCQWVGDYHGIHWFNDSKGTNTGATIAAITSLGRHKSARLLLIAGGDAKGADLSVLGDVVMQHVDQLIVLGQDAGLFQELFDKQLPCVYVDSMSAAVLQAKQLAQPDDIVLLSPACASFDMFDNYQQRGDVFMQCVRQS